MTTSSTRFGISLSASLSDCHSGAATVEEYEAEAVGFRDSLPTLNTEEFVSEDGLTFKYDRINNDFLIYKPNGEIITMYKPDRGLSYWKDQVDLYGPV